MDFNVLRKVECSPKCGKGQQDFPSLQVSIPGIFVGDTEARAMCDKFIEAVYQMPFSRSMCNKTPASVEFILFSKLWDVRRRDVRRGAICNKTVTDVKFETEGCPRRDARRSAICNKKFL
jgi:hypothetical protein